MGSQTSTKFKEHISAAADPATFFTIPCTSIAPWIGFEKFDSNLIIMCKYIYIKNLMKNCTALLNPISCPLMQNYLRFGQS